MSTREPRFNQQALLDVTPMPDNVPKVTECGASSAPLLSASFFIGDRCRPYNDDYMQCKTEARGRGEFECMLEGRKVTRCARSVIADINKSCLDEFRAHWECLDNYNQRLWQCRRQEQFLNACVFDKLGLKKTIPGTPGKEIPVHLRHRQIFADSNENRRTLTGPGSDETEFRGKLLGQWRAESAPDKEKKFAEAMAKAEKFKESTEADFKRAEEEGKLSWRQKVGYNAFLRGWSNVIDTTDMRERQREGLVAGKGEESEE